MLPKELAAFHMKKGVFGTLRAQCDALSMDAITWSSSYGSDFRNSCTG